MPARQLCGVSPRGRTDQEMGGARAQYGASGLPGCSRQIVATGVSAVASGNGAGAASIVVSSSRSCCAQTRQYLKASSATCSNWWVATDTCNQAIASRPRYANAYRLGLAAVLFGLRATRVTDLVRYYANLRCSRQADKHLDRLRADSSARGSDLDKSLITLGFAQNFGSLSALIRRFRCRKGHLVNLSEERPC